MALQSGANIPFPSVPWHWALLLLLLLSCSPSRDSSLQAGPTPRVVGLVPSLNELMVAMGAAHHLVARTDYDTHSALEDLPSVGGGLDPSLEVFVELGVDVVLTMEGQETRALTSRLDEMGIEVLSFPTNTLADLHLAIRRLGNFLGREAQADSLSMAMAGDLATIREKVSDREMISVMYVVAIDPPMTAGSGTFIDEILRVAGGRSVFDDLEISWPTVSFEAIVERNPEWLIWPTAGPQEARAHRLQEMPGWREVQAVQEGRVLVVDPNLFSRPGPALPEAALRLAAALHPDAFRLSSDTVS